MSQTSTRRPSTSGRQLRRQQSQRNPILIGGAIIVAVIVLGVIGFLLLRPKGQYIAPLGDSQHIDTPDQALPEPYNSNPPTSGWHYGGAATDPGVYTQPVSDTLSIHSLEHGFIIIHYRQDLDQQTVARLTDLTRELQQRNPCIIMTPRAVANLDMPIAMTSWTYMLKLQSYDENAIRRFFEDHVGQDSPEKVCPIGG